MSVYKMSVYKMSVYKMSVCKMSIEKTYSERDYANISVNYAYNDLYYWTYRNQCFKTFRLCR